MSVAVHHGDMLQVIPRLVAEGVVCDACVTDPPYHLLPTLKRFGADNSAPAQHGRDGAMARLSAGFMQSRWDGGDIAFRPETWETVASVMRPGAFLVAFGGTRTVHRMTCAIEDAGFIVQDCLMWLYATGFPKRRDALKPSYEPIVLAYKPGGKRTMQVDECRIGTGEDKGIWPVTDRAKTYDVLGQFSGHSETDAAAGRWPANVCHDSSDEVVACFPESAGPSPGTYDLSRSRPCTGHLSDGRSAQAAAGTRRDGAQGSVVQTEAEIQASEGEKAPCREDRQGESRMTREDEELIRTVIAKRVIERMAEQWDALALAAICGNTHPPAPTSLTYRNGRIIGLRPEDDRPLWPMVQLDKRCS